MLKVRGCKDFAKKTFIFIIQKLFKFLEMSLWTPHHNSTA